MATKSGREEPEKAEVVEEMLDTLDTAIDRVKVLYEQYFLGIQKQPPTFLHTDVERQIREVIQLQVRNTALRYRFATLQQKFAAYHAYWRRTLRQIENGTYMRNLSKIGRQAARTGAEIPEEILAAMPKRMREQVKRDREAALALAELRHRPPEDLELLTLADETIDDQMLAAIVQESAERGHDRTAGGAHKIDAGDADFDVDAFFAAITHEDARTGEPRSSATTPSPAAASPATASPAAVSIEQTAGPAPLAPPSSDLEAPVIRWRRPSPFPEPRPLEARSEAQPAGDLDPATEPGSPTIAGGAGNRAPDTESSSLDPPTVRRPSTDRPGTERPAFRRPSSDRPGSERPTLRRPVSDWTSTERPTLRRPSTERPNTERPSTERPTLRRPSTDRPGTEQPHARRPSTDRPGTEQPHARRPSTDRPGTEQPHARRPSTDRPGTEQPHARRPSTDPSSLGRPSTEQANPRLPTVRPPIPDAEPVNTEPPSTDWPSARRPGTGRTNPRLPTVRPPIPDAEPLASGTPDAAWPSAGPPDPKRPTIRPPSLAPEVERPGTSVSIGEAESRGVGAPTALPAGRGYSPVGSTTAPGAGRLNIAPPGSAPPTVRLTGPGAGRPKVGRPSSAPSSSEPPVAEAPVAGPSDTSPPDAGHPGIGGEPLADESSSTGAREPVRTERPPVIKLKIVPSNTAPPTVRLLRPLAERSGAGPSSAGAEPSSAEPSGSGAMPLESSDALTIGPLSDDLPTARMLSLSDAGSPADLPSAGSPSPGSMIDDQSTARLLNPVVGRRSDGPTAELQSTRQPSLAQLTDDQSTARLWSALRPDTGPSSAGHPGAGAEPPSTGAPRPATSPSMPPSGGRPTPPRAAPPSIRPPSAHALPQPSSPPASSPPASSPPASSPPASSPPASSPPASSPPASSPPASSPPASSPPTSSPPAAQPVRPVPSRPPAPTPAQAIRPIPVSPGAAATRTPSAVETILGPFPRIPSPPPVPNKARPASGGPPTAEDRPASPERPPPIPAASRATLVRPGLVQPRPVSTPPAERAPTGEPVPVPSGDRPAPPRPPAPPRTPLPRVAADRRTPEPRQVPPPGMTEAEVNALYTQYVQAKQTLGEDAGPDAYGKLLKTIHAQAPKIMEQYKATGVDFSVVVKDHQVTIRAKPKP